MKAIEKRSRVRAIRWTLKGASSEFGIHPATLAKRIKTQGVEKGNDGRFSTKQICSAVFGDIDSEKLRLVREQADKFALDNAERRGDLIDLPKLSDAVNRQLNAIKAHLYASSLEEEDKDKLLADIQRFWDCIEEIPRDDQDDAEQASETQG